MTEESKLKILNVMSVKEEKIEVDESSVFSQGVIKVMTPMQLNKTPQLAASLSAKLANSLTKNVTIKRLGNTSIKITKKPESRPRAEPIKMTRDHISMGSEPILNYSCPPPILNYIRLLEEHNKDLRKYLGDCRKECAQISMRCHSLTNTINEIFNKPVAKRPLMLSKQNHPYGITSQSTQQPIISPPPVQQQFKVMPRKNPTAPFGQIPQSNKIIPIFPINKIETLLQFEKDLYSNEVSTCAYTKLLSVNRFQANTQKPIRITLLLTSVLQSIIEPKLCAEKLIWDETVDPKSTAPYFKMLARVRSLYGRLLNALSNSIFKKNVDMRAVEEFLKTQAIGTAYLKAQNHTVEEVKLNDSKVQGNISKSDIEWVDDMRSDEDEDEEDEDDDEEEDETLDEEEVEDENNITAMEVSNGCNEDPKKSTTNGECIEFQTC